MPHGVVVVNESLSITGHPQVPLRMAQSHINFYSESGYRGITSIPSCTTLTSVFTMKARVKTQRQTPYNKVDNKCYLFTLVKCSEIQLYAQWYSCYWLTLSATRIFQLFISIRRQMSIIIFKCTYANQNRNTEAIYNNSLCQLYWPHRSLLHTTNYLTYIRRWQSCSHGARPLTVLHIVSPPKWSTNIPASLIATLLLTSNSRPANQD